MTAKEEKEVKAWARFHGGVEPARRLGRRQLARLKAARDLHGIWRGLPPAVAKIIMHESDRDIDP